MQTINNQTLQLDTYKVRNEIETKRNEINENETKRNQQKRNETKRKRNKTKSTKTKRNTMLDYFPHMSVFHQERTGFDHH